MTNHLRDRLAAAIWERQNPGRRWADCEYRWRADAEEDADAVLAALLTGAEREPRTRLDDLTSDQLDGLYAERDRLAAKIADYEHRITWGTSCGACARVLDSSIRETERADRAENAVARAYSLHRESCPLARGAVRRPAFVCGMCDALDHTPHVPAPAQAAEPGPERHDPTQCPGDEGFCPEHGYHRHSLKQPGDLTDAFTPDPPIGCLTAAEEQPAPVDWESIARDRERELKQVGEARHRAEAELRRYTEAPAAPGVGPEHVALVDKPGPPGPWSRAAGFDRHDDYRDDGRNRYTAMPVHPAAERAATERAWQAAADSERAAEWLARYNGSLYRHYKGGVYEVTDTATHTESWERLVVYRDPEGGTWARPMAEFTGMVDGQPRFTRIGPAPAPAEAADT